MTLKANGFADCDKCGVEIGLPSALDCVIISDMDPDDPGLVRNYHLCRDREDAKGKAVKGCATSVLTKTALKAHHEQRAKAGKPEAVRPAAAPSRTRPRNTMEGDPPLTHEEAQQWPGRDGTDPIATPHSKIAPPADETSAKNGANPPQQPTGDTDE